MKNISLLCSILAITNEHKHVTIIDIIVTKTYSVISVLGEFAHWLIQIIVKLFDKAKVIRKIMIMIVNVVPPFLVKYKKKSSISSDLFESYKYTY